MFDIKSPKFLGGQNVHNLLIIGLVSFVIYNQMKQNKASLPKND
jgi:hypothetical protein